MNEIMKIIELAVSIKPTATRDIHISYFSITDTVSVYLHSKNDKESTGYQYDAYGLTFEQIMHELTELKKDMDAERGES